MVGDEIKVNIERRRETPMHMYMAEQALHIKYDHVFTIDTILSYTYLYTLDIIIHRM